MGLKVGELTAFLTLDSSGFDRGMSTSGQKLSGLASAAGTTARAVAGAFSTAVTTLGGLGIAVGKVGYDYNRLQQSSRAALSTLLGGAEKANAQMDKLDAFAKTSPFAKQVFITAQQQLLGFGVEAKKVIPALDAIQNAVAAVGGSNDQVAQVTYALAQMQGQGKLTGETLNQLGQYGIDAAGIVGEAMGKTGAQIRELASKPGGIPVAKVWDPLVTGLMDRFGGATAAIKQQMDGATDRIKGAWRDIGSVLAAPFVDPKGGGRAVEWANKVADLLRALEQKAKPFVDIMLVRLGPGLNRITPALDRARSAINGWDLSKVNGQIDKLVHYAPLVSGLGASFFALGSGSIPVLGRFLPALNPVVAGLVAFGATSPEVRRVGQALLDTLAPLVPVLGQMGVSLADSVLSAITTLAPSVVDLVNAFVPLVNLLAVQAGPALDGFVAAAGPVVEVLAEVVSWVAGLPTPVLAAVAAFTAFKALGLAAVFKPVSAAFASFNEQVRIQTALSGTSSRAIGTIGAASVVASTGIKTVGAALKAAFISNPVGLAITGITTALGYFAGKQAEAKARVDDLRDSLDEATGAITENTRAAAYKALVDDGTIKKAKELGVALDDVVDFAIDPSSAGAERFAATLADAETQAARLKSQTEALRGEYVVADAQLSKPDGFDDLKARLHASEVAASDAGGEYGRLADLAKRLGVQSKDVAAAQAAWTDEQRAGLHATTDQTGAIRDDTSATKDNIDAKREAAGANLSLREAQLQAEDGLQRFTETAQRATKVQKDSTASDDEKAAAARDVESALLDQVRRWQTVTDAMEKNNATGRELQDTTEAQLAQFVDMAKKLGKTEQEARDLAKAYGLIPNQVYTKLVADAAAAQRVVSDFIKLNDGRRIRMFVDAKGGTSYSVPGTNVKFNAAGGAVTGGVPGKDSVLSMLMPGEHVLTVEDVNRLGGQGAVYQLRRLLASGYDVGGEAGAARYARVAAAAVSVPAPMANPAGARTAGRGDTYDIRVTVDPSRLRSMAELEAWVSDVRRLARQKAGV